MGALQVRVVVAYGADPGHLEMLEPKLNDALAKLAKAGARIIDTKLTSACNSRQSICTALALIIYEALK
ncbi:MAG: hypothetical protein RXQ97_04755 [Caldivirga sp.]